MVVLLYLLFCAVLAISGLLVWIIIQKNQKKQDEQFRNIVDNIANSINNNEDR
ncbi:TPA: hypothetical protein ACGO3I_000675 [Streptococcus suis]